jgi:hypothetical protein
MVPWNINITPKDEGGIRLIDIVTLGIILDAKWVVPCLEGCSPWQVLLRHGLLMTQHNGKVRGSFGLCDIISTTEIFQVSSSFIIKSIWLEASCSGGC